MNEYDPLEKEHAPEAPDKMLGFLRISPACLLLSMREGHASRVKECGLPLETEFVDAFTLDRFWPRCNDLCLVVKASHFQFIDGFNGAHPSLEIDGVIVREIKPVLFERLPYSL